MEASPKFAQLRSVVSGSRLLQSQPDGVLCKLALRGNAGAYEALYNRHHGALYGFVFHLLGRGASAEDAEDIAQDAFSTAFGKLADRRDDASFKSWLFTIARNRTYDQLRGRRPQTSDVTLLPIATTEGPEQQAESRAELAWLVAALAQLPDRQREALVMREMGGLSYGEIAVSMETTVPGVKQLINRARGSLSEADGGSELRSRRLRKELAALVPVIPLAITSAGVVAFGVAGTTAGITAGAGGVSGSVKIAAVMLAAAAIGGGAVGLSASQQSEGQLRTSGGASLVGDSTGGFDDLRDDRRRESNSGDDRGSDGSSRDRDDGRDDDSRGESGGRNDEDGARGDDEDARDRRDSEDSDSGGSSERESERASSGEDDHGREDSGAGGEDEPAETAEPNEPDGEGGGSDSESGSEGGSNSGSSAETQSSETTPEELRLGED